MHTPEIANLVNELLARNAIYNAIMRYCRGVDRLDRDLIRSVCHPDANDNHGSYNGPVQGFIDWVFENHENKVISSVHHIGSVLIQLDGVIAHSESHVMVNHRRLVDGKLYDLLSHGRFVDRFEERGGDWRIVDRLVVIDWHRLDPVDQEWQGPLTHELTRAHRSREDPSYAAFVS